MPKNAAAISILPKVVLTETAAKAAETFSASDRWIKPIIDSKPPKKPSAVIVSGGSSSSQRVVVIPSKYKSDIVVVVSSAEYEELLKDKEAFDAFKIDHEVLVKAKQEVDEELIKQAEHRDQMIKDLNSMQRNLVELKLSLLKHRLVILGLTVAIAAGIYLRMKGILWLEC